MQGRGRAAVASAVAFALLASCRAVPPGERPVPVPTPLPTPPTAALAGVRPGPTIASLALAQPDAAKAPRAAAAAVQEQPRRPRELGGIPAATEAGLREISVADRRFDLLSFLEGAKAAYAMVLEAFWRGDKDELRQLCDDDVYQSFSAAIDARAEAGETLDHRLIRIEDTVVHSASLDERTARIAVRFLADIAAVTRDKDGNAVAGSLDDAVESCDIWTFSRDVTSAAPDWVLDETDEG